MYGIPGMYAPEHIRAWKVVTDTVHAKGAYMACQLWHVSLPFTSLGLRLMVYTVRTFRSLRADWRTPAIEFFRHKRQLHECFHAPRKSANRDSKGDES
jgi:NADH:flavin oxidoreductase / NADH oxidase family